MTSEKLFSMKKSNTINEQESSRSSHPERLCSPININDSVADLCSFSFLSLSLLYHIWSYT